MQNVIRNRVEHSPHIHFRPAEILCSILEINEKLLVKKFNGSLKNKFSNATKQRILKNQDFLRRNITPELYCRIDRITHAETGYIKCETGVVFNSVKLSNMLKNARFLFSFIATVGPEIDREMKRQTKQRRLSDAFVLDVMASLAIENMVDYIWKSVKAFCREKGLYTTLRLSPGYCDWPLEEQQKLFFLFKSRQSAITLSPSHLMTPRKTISGIFGISQHAQDAEHNPCRRCHKSKCPTRRV
ncbi:conserved hypothetical protein [Candidatus Desulfarcum epimagneticum]|uniref:Uncharacterized protein n=1 Tax=uncultured Desulfobacteraceae bacterium TaxID=218296 RepID=A0A484HJ26_9BACT|nr:conserved hypothetical protein [uncultured Desulfobacteraceae bacterium]